MRYSKWDVRFLTLAAHVALWSKDPSTKVGAVIADERNRIMSIGFNGPARGTSDDHSVFSDRAEKLRRTLHAESNAIDFARADLTGTTMYVTQHPCAQCASRIVQVGIAVVMYPAMQNPEFEARWKADIASAANIFAEAGVLVVGVVTPEEPLLSFEVPLNVPPSLAVGPGGPLSWPVADQAGGYSIGG